MSPASRGIASSEEYSKKKRRDRKDPGVAEGDKARGPQQCLLPYHTLVMPKHRVPASLRITLPPRLSHSLQALCIKKLGRPTSLRSEEFQANEMSPKSLFPIFRCKEGEFRMREHKKKAKSHERRVPEQNTENEQREVAEPWASHAEHSLFRKSSKVPSFLAYT